MQRWFKLWMAAALLVILVLLVLWAPRENALSVGPPLPTGQVEPQLVSAWDTGVLLAPDGSLWIWGGTASGLVDILGQTNRTPIPRRLTTNSNWEKVAVGHSHMLALKNDGSLWAWGKFPRDLVRSNRISSTLPRRVDAETAWKTIAAGVAHCMALKRDGSLWTWGCNHYGQLGIGTTNSAEGPVPIDDDHWNAIAAGAFNSFALRRDGTLWGWGLDPLGGRPATNDLSPRQIDSATNWLAISASSYCLLGLKADGSLWVRGQNARWTAPAYVTNATAAFTRIGADLDWKQIYCGEQYIFARKGDGSWWSCGQNHYGQTGLGLRQALEEIRSPQRLPFTFEPWAIALGADEGTTLILLKDGTLWTCGVRLGEKTPSSRFDKLKRTANRISQLLPGHPVAFPIRQYRLDSAPRKFWRLPREKDVIARPFARDRQDDP